MADGRKNILEIDALTVAYRLGGRKVHAIKSVSLSIAEGEAVGLVGESGSGKSTLARVPLGLNPLRTSMIDAGRIVIGGRDVTGFDENQWEALRGNPVAMVFQDPLTYLNPIMRIGRQIAESVRRHTPELPVEQRVRELLELVKLPAACAGSYPHELSGGMRQRALLAIAVGCSPKLLIADEPTTALDVTTQAEILNLLKDLRERLGMAMLLISHDLGIVSEACERIYVMYGGRILEWGQTDAVFQDPAQPYTVELLRAAQAARNAEGRFATIGGAPPNMAELGDNCPFMPRCSYAMDECSVMPGRWKSRNSTHSVRCWLYKDPRRGFEAVEDIAK